MQYFLKFLVLVPILALTACGPSLLSLPTEENSSLFKNYQFKMSNINIDHICNTLIEDQVTQTCQSADDINNLILNDNLYAMLQSRTANDVKWANKWRMSISDATHRLASSGQKENLNRVMLEELYPGMLPLLYKQKPNTKQASLVVVDFEDKTQGEYGIDWYGGCSYLNVSSIVTDAIVGTLKKSGRYSSVSRIKNRNEAGNADIVVSGEIKRFQSAGRPHPTVFINPLCAFSLFGLPTAYANTYRVGDISVLFRDAKSNELLQSIPIFVEDSYWRWVSPYYICLDHKTAGNEIVEMLSYKFHQSLNILDSK